MTARPALVALTSAPNPLWFIDRSAGEVTLLLMSAVVILGIIRAAVPTAYPMLIEGTHTNLALLTIAFAGLHIVAAVLDPFAGLGPVDALVPFASAYRGMWLGLGVISGYLYGVAVVTSWPARRLPRAGWLWLHRTIYAGWVLALVHSFATGSDSQNRLFLLLDVVAVAAVLIAFLAYRVAEGWPANPSLWAAVAVIALVTSIGLAVWAVNGPLQPGWARSSGTPANLLRGP
jgi:methionine sulfoxide reductase heme-binding subunit